MNREKNNTAEAPARLKQHLSPLGLWALSFGCAVGWGAFAMPGNTFLPIAGPLGTVLGIGIGAAIMLLLAANYYFLMNKYPEAGGAYAYTKHIFAHRRAHRHGVGHWRRRGDHAAHRGQLSFPDE